MPSFTLPSQGRIPPREISLHTPPLLVAEIGMNHKKDLSYIKELIKEAKKQGAEVIKLQSYSTENFIEKTPETKKLFSLFKSLELSWEEHQKIYEICQKEKIFLASTPLTIDWVEKLSLLEVPFFKVASGDLLYWELYLHLFLYPRPLFISTGAHSWEDIQKVYHFLKAFSPSPFLFLHCTSIYPTPLEKAELRSLFLLQKLFPDTLVGYSDHTLGEEAAFLAVALGACVVEKHFTLTPDDPMGDHQISADPNTLGKISSLIRKAYLMRGEGKKPLPEEENPLGRRSWYKNKWKRPRKNTLPYKEEVLMHFKNFNIEGGGRWQNPK